MISPFMILVGWERGGAGLSQPTSNMKVEIVFVRLGAEKAHPNREQTLFLVFHVKEVGVVGGREASLPSFPHHNQLLCHEILMLGWGPRSAAPSPTNIRIYMTRSWLVIFRFFLMSDQ